MNIQIFPLDKVILDNTSICFGMEKSAVELALGVGEVVENRCYYFDSEVAIDYQDGKVDFIEFMSGVDGKLKPIIYGVSVFDVDAAELVDVLKKNNNGEICDDENGYSYLFSNISIGVYREALPDEITEMIEEAKNDGNPMSDDEIEYEMKRANYWATIGVGITGYYQRQDDC